MCKVSFLYMAYTWVMCFIYSEKYVFYLVYLDLLHLMWLLCFDLDLLFYF